MNKNIEMVDYMHIMDRSSINAGDYNPLAMIYKLKLKIESKNIVNEPIKSFRETKWFDPFQRDIYNNS